MKKCKCGAPVEAERYEFCYDCWWAQDPRNKHSKGEVPAKRIWKHWYDDTVYYTEEEARMVNTPSEAYMTVEEHERQFLKIKKFLEEQCCCTDEMILEPGFKCSYCDVLRDLLEKK